MSSNTTNNYKGPYAIEPPSFKVEPVYLSPEHAKQVERFQGFPYDAEQDARQKGYSAFKAWHHRLQLLDQQALLEEENVNKKTLEDDE
jgi:hypothetical protein